MKLLIAGLVSLAALAGMSSCASGYQGNDGISRFADGGTYGPYYGPGSPPRDGGGPGPHA
jgi:hypothetical protein